jgi:RNA polymerase sigma factor (sigma-70 family)
MSRNPRPRTQDRPRAVRHLADAEDGRGAYYARIGGARSVTDPEEERVLIRLWQRHWDARARDIVVQSHLRFVVRQAHRKTSDRSALQDYIAAGNLGLLKAIQPGHFNTERVPYIRFLTYAGTWVYKEMMDQDYASSSTVHIPTHKQKEQRKLAHAQRVAATVHGPRSEAATSVECVTYPVVRIEDVCDEDLCAGVEIAGDYHAKQLSDLLEAALSQLPTREATIIRLHYGVRDEPRSLEQIGKIMSMTPERVRQIKVGALKLVRAHLEGDVLRRDLEGDSALFGLVSEPAEPAPTP